MSDSGEDHEDDAALLSEADSEGHSSAEESESGGNDDSPSEPRENDDSPSESRDNDDSQFDREKTNDSDRPMPDGESIPIESDSDVEMFDESSKDRADRNDPPKDVVEIESDDEERVEAVGDDKNSTNSDVPKRSARKVNRKNYKELDDYGIDKKSEIDEAVNRDADENAIVVNDARKLLDLAFRGNESLSKNGQKKEPTVVIIDTESNKSLLSQVLSKNSAPTPNVNVQNMIRNIGAGTTVTPVSVKKTRSPSASAARSTSSAILPSLTDDMFVLEAPSFIVPYIYEKPSIEPFRKFVNDLGKRLDDVKRKDESEKDSKMEKLLSEFKSIESEINGNSKKGKRRRGRGGDDDDASWDGESTSNSDDLSSDDDKPKSNADEKGSASDKAKNADLVISAVPGEKSDNYFANSLGKFFMDIGTNLIQEYVQKDLLKYQKKRLSKETRMGGANTKATRAAIGSLLENIEFSREINAPYKFKQKRCEICNFKSESSLILAHHMESPHMKLNVYKCNFCPYECRSPHDILFHTETQHGLRGRLEKALAYHQCPNCPFEDNNKGKLVRHSLACAKRFKPESNLAPPLDWEPPAKIPKINKARHPMDTYMTDFRSVNNVNAGIQQYLTNNITQMKLAQIYKTQQNHGKFIGKAIQNAQLVNKLSQPMNHQMFSIGQTSINPVVSKPVKNQSSVSITAVPSRSAGSSNTAQGKSPFVICEICDGYIKDLEQLRNHVLWMHSIKIHPKVIFGRPPLNCQKCHFRFFTDQGLERHLLASHGLVTSSMQEAAIKGTDAGRCLLCGQHYRWKLLEHVARDHNLTLKPANLSYKCTVCTATFGMYKEFESHVYSAHSTKRSANKTTTDKTILKPLNSNAR